MATKEKIEQLEKIPNIFKRREYGLWKNMIEICYDKSSPMFKSFGAKGIEVCQLWREKKGSRGYLHFIGDMGFIPDKSCTLRRLNPKDDFKPSNCIWYSSKEYYVRNSNGCIEISIMDYGIFSHLK